jgi:predicted amidohydrolase
MAAGRGTRRRGTAMRIGAVTLCSRRGENERNLARIVRYGELAAERGCKLVLFPEFSVCGPWVSYDPEARPEDLVRQAEPVPGPATDYLVPHARRLGIAFCVGVAEAGLTARPFNTAVVVDGGGVVHRQRKLQPTVSEVPFFRGGGDDVGTFVLDGTAFGTVICADNGAPRLHDRLYALGARVFLLPHAGAIKKHENPGAPWTSWDELLAFYARDRFSRLPRYASRLGVTLVYADAKDARRDFDDLPAWPHYVSGKGAVLDPGGRVVAENAGNEEGLIVADV